MGIRFVSGKPASHPINELIYPLVQKKLKFARHEIIVETLADVEPAIDLVFEWLDRRALGSEEIEHLAPYFGVVWPAALGLAHWLAVEGEAGRLTGKLLLEIGCGLGIPGLLATKYGAVVTLSDGHPDVLRFLEKNLSLNNISAIDFATPDWHTGVTGSQTFDYIVASDILYESYHPDFFARIFNDHAHSKSVIVLTDPGRAYIQKFVNSMRALGWMDALESWHVPNTGKSSDIFLLKFERR